MGTEKVCQFFAVFGIDLVAFAVETPVPVAEISLAPEASVPVVEWQSDVCRRRFCSIPLGLACFLVCIAKLCCSSNASCMSLQCPVRYLPKENLTHLVCSGRSCSVASDLDTCCDKIPTCDTFQCPVSHRLKRNAASIWCSGRDCTSHHCCERLATCSSFTCPQWYQTRYEAEDLECFDTPCNVEADLDRCCQLAVQSVLSSGRRSVESVQSFFANVLTCPACPLYMGGLASS